MLASLAFATDGRSLAVVNRMAPRRPLWTSVSAGLAGSLLSSFASCSIEAKAPGRPSAYSLKKPRSVRRLAASRSSSTRRAARIGSRYRRTGRRPSAQRGAVGLPKPQAQVGEPEPFPVVGGLSVALENGVQLLVQGQQPLACMELLGHASAQGLALGLQFECLTPTADPTRSFRFFATVRSLART